MITAGMQPPDQLLESYALGVAELARFIGGSERVPFRVEIIVNPRAGFFRNRRRLRRIIADLERHLGDLSSREPPGIVRSRRVHWTTAPGHARGIALAVAGRVLPPHATGTVGGEASAAADRPVRDRYEDIERVLIVAAGGDGTANEIRSALMPLPADVLQRIELFHLPLGTGNDAADAATVEEAHRILTGPLRVIRSPAIMLTTATGEVAHAFNIASIGLDAWIADLTNRCKRFVPGDAYRLVVNAAIPFYKYAVRQRPMRVRVSGAGHGSGPNHEREQRWYGPECWSMVVFGASGRRTYGGGMAVLPDEANLCLIGPMSLRRKLATKSRFYRGEHLELPEVRVFDADEVIIEVASPDPTRQFRDWQFPVQLDGEVRGLAEADFPLRFTRLPPLLRTLGPRP